MPSSAGLVETHISIVFFVGSRAYKLKKPVDFPFVDLRTREARERLCHREVELNRRFSPDVYLGVADITGPDGALADHLVVMRRMPADRRLSDLVRRADPQAGPVVDQVAAALARFHAEADRSAEIDAAASAGAVLGLWRENFDELRPFGEPAAPGAEPALDSTRIARAEHLADAFVAGRQPLFAARVADGHVCDGHGDLQADDIFCLEDGPRILDCIEFCDAFRYGDVANDVAFLAMDLERLGAPDLAVRCIEAYDAAAGEELPAALASFYIAYRAQVRAKVSCLRYAQEDPGAADAVAVRDAARRYLDLCLAHLEQASPRLVLVGGAPGVGKSTVARSIADALAYPVIRSDVVRKRLAGLDPHRSAAAALGAGLYTAAATEAVYTAMLDDARAHLDQGRSVILDATFGAAHQRELARDLARSTRSALVELRCALDRELVTARIEERRAAGADPSDATPEVAAALAAAAEPWPEAVVLDTARPRDDVARDAIEVTRATLPV